MNKLPEWKVPKLPFVVANLILLVTAAAIVFKAAHPISSAIIFLVVGCVALGVVLGCLPFILDYRATGKLIEVHAVGEVSEKIQDLKNSAAQISAATGQWARVQEVTQQGAEKTTVAAREIADRMETEVKEFNEFQSKMNDAEKGALRLEVEKLRRAERDWLQAVIRILDNIFVLHVNAVRSGHSELSNHIGQFQNACHNATRRLGLTPFVPLPDEPFNPERHNVESGHNPAAGIIAETIAPGFTYQGRPVRSAMVRLRPAEMPVENISEKSETDELPLTAD
jgi:molecular chaperone GrpE (heat shock protein)